MREGTQQLPVRGPRSSLPATPSELGPGTRLGRHELLVEIGRGGMAQVWIARLQGDLGFSRLVAVKTILPELGEDPAFRRSLFEESRLAAKLRHANVVEVMELAEDGPFLFQVMPLVEGPSLADLLPKGRLDAGLAARVLSDALAGLHAAHELCDDEGHSLQLVHRDVSPHNILVGADGVSRLTDFGVAKALGSLSEATQIGQVRGKPGYLSPEQASSKPLDRRSDVFAAGIVLWESLTARRLFRGVANANHAAKLGDRVYPSPRDLVPDIPEVYADIALRALRWDREERYATAQEMRDALEEAAQATGTVATARDVAALISARFGPKLEERREKLRELSRAQGRPTAPPPAPVAAAPTMSLEEARAAPPAAIALALTASATPREGPPPLPARASLPPEPPPAATLPVPITAVVPKRVILEAEGAEETALAEPSTPPRRGAWIAAAAFIAALAATLLWPSPEPTPLELPATAGEAPPPPVAATGLAPRPAAPSVEAASRAEPAPPTEPTTTAEPAGAEPAEAIEPAAEGAEPAAAPRRAAKPVKKKPRPMFSNPYP